MAECAGALGHILVREFVAKGQIGLGDALDGELLKQVEWLTVERKKETFEQSCFED